MVMMQKTSQSDLPVVKGHAFTSAAYNSTDKCLKYVARKLLRVHAFQYFQLLH